LFNDNLKHRVVPKVKHHVSKVRVGSSIQTEMLDRG
jgi:hypothetical protein